MSQPVSSQSYSTTARSQSLDQSASIPLSAAQGDGFRVDAPHQNFSAATSNHEEELLIQASQMAENLRSHMEQFDQREENLRRQFDLLEEERNNIRQWAAHHEKSMLAREDQVQQRGVELSQQFRACEKLVAELERQETSLLQSTEQLEAGRATLRNELNQELNVDRDALGRAQEAVVEERILLADLIEKNNHNRAEAFEEGRIEWESQQEELQIALLDNARQELVSERDELSEERSRWEMLRDAQYEDLSSRKEQTDLELKQTQTDLAEARIRHMQDLETEREDHFRRIEESVEEFEYQQKLSQGHVEAEKKEWDSQKENELTQIEHERELNSQAIAKSEEEIKTLRETIQEELQLAKQKQEEKLKAEQENFEIEQIQKKENLQKEQKIFENRMRFQQDHLTKLRQELELLQKEIRSTQQKAQASQEDKYKVLELRTRQLAQYRNNLETREASLNREQELLNNHQQDFKTELTQDKTRFKTDRDAWDEENVTQRAEIKRQQEMLTLHAENIEGRKDRLDKLRSELELTHQETLTMKISLEESFAQFSQVAGDETAQQNVDAARKDLEQYYQQALESLQQQRSELSQSRAELNQYQAIFREEQKQLAATQNNREEQFKVWEESLRRDTDQIEASMVTWKSQRNKWTTEKVEAENLIRNLLEQLTEKDASPKPDKTTKENHQPE